MHKHAHPGLEDHPLGAELIQLYVEIHIALRPLDESAAQLFQPADELPGNAADYPFSAESEFTDRGHIAHRSHTAEETVTFHQGDLRPHPRGCDCGYETGRAAAAHDYVETSGIRGSLAELPFCGAVAGNSRGSTAGTEGKSDCARHTVF